MSRPAPIQTARCPIHNRRLLCPACLGARGGQASSPAKTKAASNAARTRWADHRKEETMRTRKLDEWIDKVFDLAGLEPPAARWNTWGDALDRARQIVAQAGMLSLIDRRPIFPAVEAARDAGELVEPTGAGESD